MNMAGKRCASAADVRWLTLRAALGEIEAMPNDADAERSAFLQEHRDHLAQCMANALSVLQAGVPLGHDLSRAGPSPSQRTPAGAATAGHRLDRKELIRRISGEQIHIGPGDSATQLNEPLPDTTTGRDNELFWTETLVTWFA
jgi:hypothetical protein